jgi:Yip1 domain
MIKALLLIFDPTRTWDGIIRARRSLVSILLVYLLPMLLLISACEAYGLTHWGKMQGDGLLSKLKKLEPQVPRLKTFTAGEAVVAETAQLLLSLAVVFVGARLVKSVGETFRGRHTYLQAFTAVAYGLGPLFLLRVFDAFTSVSPWATWAIGIILSIAVLYQGVPRAMEPDPAHAFGVYLMSAVLLAFVTALARFVTASYLEGEFPGLEAIVAGLTDRLPC